MIQPWEAYDGMPDYPADDVVDLDFNDDNYQLQEDIVVKQEADHAAGPGSGDLPLKVLASGYDKKVLLQQVLEASKAVEDVTYPDL
jgi:hypothetical protein